MNKYLFTDGANGVKELQSKEELQAQIETAQFPDKILIWIFSSNEWINIADFRKKYSFILKKEKEVFIAPAVVNETTVRTGKGKHWLKKFLIVSSATAGVILIFNFTKITWTKAAPVNSTAARPVNVPVMDIDSLIKTVEDARGSVLDRSTRANLRLRNTWPDKIELKLNAERESGSGGFRYFNANVLIDNSSGFILDEARVKLSVWKNGKAATADTLSFNNIRYDKISSGKFNGTYIGDSISVSFESIKAKAFNFCYSAAVKNNSGNYNDRWFCRE